MRVIKEKIGKVGSGRQGNQRNTKYKCGQYPGRK
jgi:hypothetical protein